MGRDGRLLLRRAASSPTGRASRSRSTRWSGCIPLLPVGGRPAARSSPAARRSGKRFARFMDAMHVSDGAVRGRAASSPAGRATRCFQISVVPPVRLERLLGEMLSEDGVPVAARAARAVAAPPRRAVPARARRADAQVDYEPASRRRACSAATPTGAARSGCRSTTWSSSRCGTGTLFWATTSRSSTRPARATRSGCATSRSDLAAPAGLDLAARRRRPAAGLRLDREVPDRPGVARPAAVPRVLPRRHRGRASAPRTRPAGRARGPPALPRRRPRGARRRGDRRKGLRRSRGGGRRRSGIGARSMPE